MEFIKKMIIVIIVAILILSVLMILISRYSAEIIDLIHLDTDYSRIGERDLSDPLFDQYRIDGIVFTPYTRLNHGKGYNDDFYTYSLRLAVYKQLENSNKVIVNHFEVDGVKDVKFNKIAGTINKELEFDDGGDGILSSEDILIDVINNYNMELNKKSQLKVVLNVSVVDEDGKLTTRDLEYYFETNIRKYFFAY